MRSPDSVRGLRESVTYDYDAPESLIAPAWLSENAASTFTELVDSLIQANVPIKAVDTYSIAMAAQCVTSVAEWSERETSAQTLGQRIDCSKLIARYQRDSQQWLAAICATPVSRARLHLKPPQKRTGTVAALLEMKKRTG